MMRVLYKDKIMLVVHKPAGYLVYGDKSTAGTPDCKAILEKKFRIKIFPVHRLDKDTSGILIFALSKTSAFQLSNALRSSSTEKKYLALSRGELKGFLKIDKPLKKNKSKDVEPATTVFHTLENFKIDSSDFTLLEASLETGRYHQIRRHLSGIRHAIVGDRIYGPKHEKPLPRQMHPDKLHLCAHFLKIQHPLNKKFLIFQTNPDQEFQNCLQFLRKNSASEL